MRSQKSFYLNLICFVFISFLLFHGQNKNQNNKSKTMATLLKQLERASRTAWCPAQQYSSLLASGKADMQRKYHK
jgi:hypothetical protein